MVTFGLVRGSFLDLVWLLDTLGRRGVSVGEEGLNVFVVVPRQVVVGLPGTHVVGTQGTSHLQGKTEL